MSDTSRYPAYIFWSVEDEGFIAIAPDLPGCSAFGGTQAEAFSRPWLDTFSDGDYAMMKGIMAKATRFDVVAFDQSSVAGWTVYGIPIASTYSVRIVSRALPVPFTLSFHLNNIGNVVAIDPD